MEPNGTSSFINKYILKFWLNNAISTYSISTKIKIESQKFRRICNFDFMKFNNTHRQYPKKEPNHKFANKVHHLRTREEKKNLFTYSTKSAKMFVSNKARIYLVSYKLQMIQRQNKQ